MSEAIRSYRPARRGSYDGPSRPGGPLRWIVPALFVLACTWFIWTTRDSCPVERVIPSNQSFHVQVRDLLTTRLEIADSPVWDTGLVPENYAAIPSWLGNNFGYPDWVLNNLVSGICYVSGTDLTNFSDLLVVTRMSRIGCMLERWHGYLDGIEDEHAGGLALRKLGEADFYYAVRGRTLIFSPSRDAIVRALTLRDTDAIASLETAGLDVSDDLQGRMQFSPDEALGQYFEQSDCRLAIDQSSITFSSRSVLKPDWRAPLDGLGLAQPSENIIIPRDSGLVMAGDFGVPLAEVWKAINDMSMGGLDEFVGRWGALDRLSPSEREALNDTFGQLSGVLGTRFFIQAAGFDLNGMAPAPILDLMLEPAMGPLNAILEEIPPVADGTLPRAGLLYQSPEEELLRLPMGWGDVFEPSAYWDGPRLHVVLHPQHALDIRATKSSAAPASGVGHLYVQVRPVVALEIFQEGALLYAGSGLIPGYTPDSLVQSIEDVSMVATQVPEISVMIGYNAGELSVDLKLVLVTPEE